MAKIAGGIEQAGPVNINLPVPGGTLAGDVIALVDLVVYVQTDRDADGYAVCSVPCHFAEVVAVTGEDDSGASAVAVGDRLAVDGAAVNKDVSGGTMFGYALGTVVAGATSNILVGFGL